MNWIEIEKPTHKIENCKWVACIAEIRHNETGEIREYETHEILKNGDEFPNIFNWSLNNYSCDCNRHLFFKRAKGEQTQDDFDVECSHEKYSVNLKNKLDGIIYYREYDENTKK